MSHDELGVLAEHQAALRRVATLVARGASPSEVFAAVSDELARCLHAVNAGLLRYEPDGSGCVVDVQYEPGITNMPVAGERIPLAGDDVGALVLRTGRAARIDSHDGVIGPEAERIRDAGIGSIVGAPIVIDGHLWGAAIIGTTKREPLPPDAEARLCDFTDLVATAIANAQTRADLRVLAEQQAALRRVATLVARGVAPTEVFSAVAEELAHCLGVHNAGLCRLEPDGAATLVAARDESGLTNKLVGQRFSLEGENIVATVLRTGRAARMDNHDNAAGPAAARIRELGMRSAVGAPIIVAGRLWGAATVSTSRPEPLPADTEARVCDFADLVATAIANAQAHAELTASRARIVAAADHARRRIERDLHDGAQQRLVSLGLELRNVEADVPARPSAAEGADFRPRHHRRRGFDGSAGALSRNSSGDPVQGRTGSSDQSAGPSLRNTGRTGPWCPSTVTGPGRGGRLLRRRRSPDERGQIRARVDCGSSRRYRGAGPAICRSETTESAEPMPPKDPDSPASATALRRSVASCRSRVTPAWGRHCTPGSRSKLLRPTHSDDASAALCSTDSFEG